MSRPFSALSCLAKPKSQILMDSAFPLSSTYRMLLGFRSLCTTCKPSRATESRRSTTSAFSLFTSNACLLDRSYYTNLTKPTEDMDRKSFATTSKDLLLYCHSLFVLFDCCMMEKWAYFIFKSVSSVVQWTLHARMLAACHSLLYPPL